jgi:ketosteroid isomerase-like protein
MPDEDFEVVRRAWAAASRGDDDAMLRECHLDVVAIPFGAVMEGTAYRGHDEVRAWWRGEILVTWEFFEVYPESFERVGDKLLVTGRWKARGIESGVELDMPASWVVEVRGSKIAYWQTYTDHAQARRDIGLED